MGLGLKNQFILAKTIDFSLLVQQKLSVESSINDGVHQKKVSNFLKWSYYFRPDFALILPNSGCFMLKKVATVSKTD